MRMSMFADGVFGMRDSITTSTGALIKQRREHIYGKRQRLY
jgi:hypothetical protein